MTDDSCSLQVNQSQSDHNINTSKVDDCNLGTESRWCLNHVHDPQRSIKLMSCLIAVNGTHGFERKIK